MTFREYYAAELAGRGTPLSTALLSIEDGVHTRLCVSALRDFLTPLRLHMQESSAIDRNLRACPYKYRHIEPSDAFCRECWDTEMEAKEL